MPSTFSSPTVGSAYFYRRRAGHRTVCRSTGFELLYSVQVVLRTALEALGTLPSAGGMSISFDQVAVIDLTNPTAGPGWDDTTLRALYAYTARGARSYLPDIAADIMRRGGVLSERTMKAAMWSLDSQGVDAAGNDTYGLGSPDEISFDSNAAFPSYGEIPPMPQNRTVEANAGNCTPIAEGAVAGDPITTTATFGVDVGLLLLVIAAGVFGIANATAKPRQNPSVKWSREVTKHLGGWFERGWVNNHNVSFEEWMRAAKVPEGRVLAIENVGYRAGENRTNDSYRNAWRNGEDPSAWARKRARS